MKSAAVVWKAVVGVILALAASAVAVWVALRVRGRRVALGGQLEELALDQLKQTKANGKQAVAVANEKAVTGWAEDQQEHIEKAKHEVQDITPDDLWDRLRK